MEDTKRAIEWFRNACVKAGLPDLHLQFTMRNKRFTNLTGVDSSKNVSVESFGSVGFDSCMHYQFVHYTDIDRNYEGVLADVEEEWKRLEKLPFPYFPHISVGWDNNPRFNEFHSGVLKNCTPENIKTGLRMAKSYADRHPKQPPLIAINNWNEWTESSYLEPDDLYGYGYLDAIKKAFVDQN